jgi:hypothetical protein
MKFGKLLLIGGLCFLFSQTTYAQAPQRFKQERIEQRFDHPRQGKHQIRNKRCKKARFRARKHQMRKRHFRRNARRG